MGHESLIKLVRFAPNLISVLDPGSRCLVLIGTRHIAAPHKARRQCAGTVFLDALCPERESNITCSVHHLDIISFQSILSQMVFDSLAQNKTSPLIAEGYLFRVPRAGIEPARP